MPSGVAADTGTYVHEMIHLFHRGRDPLEAVQRGDLRKARALYAAYAADPRNAVATQTEIPVKWELAPGVWVQGTADQLRQGDRLEVWDVKTGDRLGGPEMLLEHAIQLAAYAVGLGHLLGEPVHPGGIIRVPDYAKKGPVFHKCHLTLDTARRMLDSLVPVVERIRRGEVHLAPGVWCRWCPAQQPANCIKVTV
jgi:hypothetical protein